MHLNDPSWYEREIVDRRSEWMRKRSMHDAMGGYAVVLLSKSWEKHSKSTVSDSPNV
jgi:hypothetical protein